MSTSPTWTTCGRAFTFGGLARRTPVAEWQREGFDMFGAMLERVYRDFVTYVMHVQVTAGAD